MAEEHGFKASEGHRLCVNNCGFFGSSATQNMCSKCYRDLTLKKSGDPSLFSTPLTSPVPSSSSNAKPIVAAVSSPEKVLVTPEADTAPAPATKTNRCSTCRKKVGLTGFRCRCGITFCGNHRYPEKHGCSFDFKTMGKEAIAKANPVVKAEKLDKI
ncbi:hypothetical protein RD792_014226 [Penstemon davidsonii]|uniref:Uncharacterized protein n=1 Tax=Penstemon davidsonii TaxID=160366 RepID=A0ABR0CNQ8_9LAMI|nr:hypothetical protein RD792_014226 [Penstemon davidsonii]